MGHWPPHLIPGQPDKRVRPKTKRETSGQGGGPGEMEHRLMEDPKGTVQGEPGTRLPEEVRAVAVEGRRVASDHVPAGNLHRQDLLGWSC